MTAKIKVWGLILGCFCMCHFVHGQVLENYNPKISLGKKHDFYHVFSHAVVDLDLEEFPKSTFEFQFPAQSAIYLGGRLWFYAEKDTLFHINTGELHEKFPHEPHQLLVFKKGVQKEDISIKKRVIDSEAIVYPEESEATSMAGLRDKDPLRNFFFVAIIIILMLLALFKVTYPVVYSSFVRPASVFSSDDFTEYNVFGKVFSSDVLFQVLVFSMLVMLFLMVGAYYGDGLLSEYLISSDLNDLFFIWLSGAVIFMVLSLLKYFWVKLSIKIYQLERHELSQFLYVMRVFLWVLLGIFGVLAVTKLQLESKMGEVVEYVVIAFFVVYLLSIIRLFNLMMRRVSFKNYHLFSYLCTSELVPFLVIVKLIMG